MTEMAEDVSGDDDWATRRRRERDRETAAGSGRHWDSSTPRPKVQSSSRQLRRFERGRARLHVLCRSRCIAAVLQGARPGELQVAVEPVGVTHGRGTRSDPSGGFAVTLLNLASVGAAPLLVGCRCGDRHQLDAYRLRAESWAGRPGKPRAVGVSQVATGGSGI